MSLERVKERLDGVEYGEVETADGMPCIRLERDALTALMTVLHDELDFETCTLVTAVDRFPETPRFRLVWQFLSIKHNDRLRVHCEIEDHETIPSATGVWPGANYFEREVFDLFGVHFDGHPHMKRLLMPEGYEHHPLRKDFPHQGIEPDKLYREWDRRRRQSQVHQGGGSA